jgi:NAD(P)-dependent dehydrogenase (short-subunit alcohol dehydrogenase family)
MTVEGFNLEGKVATVAGAGQSLGKAVALALAEAGADVVVTSCTHDAQETKVVEAVATEIGKMGRRSMAISLDVTVAPEVDGMVAKVVAQMGKMDVLVNNTDLVFAKPCIEVSDEEWNKVIAANLSGVFFLSRAAARQMLKQGKGRIINVTTGLALRGIPNGAVYCASKGGVIQLTRALALEWAQQNIRVNGIGCGWFADVPGPQQDETLRGSLLRYLPMHRLGQPHEIGAVAVYLASDTSDIMAGDTIFIDGGVMAHG